MTDKNKNDRRAFLKGVAAAAIPTGLVTHYATKRAARSEAKGLCIRTPGELADLLMQVSKEIGRTLDDKGPADYDFVLDLEYFAHKLSSLQGLVRLKEKAVDPEKAQGYVHDMQAGAMLEKEDFSPHGYVPAKLQWEGFPKEKQQFSDKVLQYAGQKLLNEVVDNPPGPDSDSRYQIAYKLKVAVNSLDDVERNAITISKGRGK